MRAFASLVRKELRDARTFLLLAMALSAVVLVVAKLVFGGQFDAELRSQWVTTLALAVVAVVLSAEAVGRDAASGVEALWERLAVDRALVWTAKVVAVVLGTALYAGCEVALESALRAFEPAPRVPLPVFGDLLPFLVLPCMSVVATAALLRRSLPAALVGVGAVVALPLLGEKLQGRAALTVALAVERWSPLEFAWIAVLAFALASLAAFRARGWRFLQARRLGAATAGFWLVLGPVLGTSAAAARAGLAFGLFHPGAAIKSASLSPDGRFLAVQVTRHLRLRHDWFRYDGVKEVWRVWVLDREHDTWLDLADEDWRTLMPDTGYGWFGSPWAEDGSLATAVVDLPTRADAQRLELIDPRTGGTSWWSDAPDAWTRQLQEMGRPRWYRLEHRGDAKELTWLDRGQTVEVPRLGGVSPVPGVYFEWREAALLRVDLRDGTETTLHGGAEGGFVHSSPDGQWISFITPEGTFVLDSASGEPVVEHLHGLVSQWSRLPGRIGFVTRSGGDRYDALLLADGTERRLASEHVGNLWIEDGDDALIRYEFGGTTIERCDLDGHVLEVLYPR